MKVKELKEILSTANDNDLVVLSADDEGNSFNTLYSVSEGIYVTETKEIRLSELTPELRKEGYSDGDVYHGNNGQKAVVLWP